MRTPDLNLPHQRLLGPLAPPSLLAAALLTLAPPLAAHTPPTERPIEVHEAEWAAELDQELAKIYPADEPGAAILVVDDGVVVFRRAYGMADLELEVELEPDMVFRLGSITKQFTAAAILLLAEDGKLALDDPLTRFLPEYPVGDEVPTIEHLLTHTSGIFSYTSIPGYMKDRVRRDLTTDELIAEFQDHPVEFSPGERWSYSNSGYVLLGAIIERAGGKSYADFVHRRIFESLRMEDSYYGGRAIIPHRVSGYDRAAESADGDDGYVNAAFLSMTQPHGAGGLLSTVDDLARWDAALHGGKLLTPESYEVMTTRYELNDGTEVDYGYGVSLSTLRGRQVIQHGGGIFGFNTFAIRVPEENLFVVVLSNTTARDLGPGPVALKIAALAMGDPFTSFERAPVAIETLERLVGVYEIETGGTREVTREAGRLYTRRGGGPRLEAIPAGDGIFFYEGSLTWFEVVEEDGKPVMLMHQDGADKAERAVWKAPAGVQRTEIELAPEALGAFVGRYELAPGFVLTITLEDGRLMSQATGQAKVPIFAESKTRFFLKVVDAQLEFTLGEDGRATSLVLFQAGREIPAKRVD